MLVFAVTLISHRILGLPLRRLFETVPVVTFVHVVTVTAAIPRRAHS
jgi:hypothetical protein